MLAVHLIGLLGEIFLYCAAGLSLLAMVGGPNRRFLIRLAIHLSGSALLGLLLGLATDKFGLAYVYLYSRADFGIFLKLANLWGGDEGTLLILGICLLGTAPYIGRAGSIALRSQLFISGWYLLAAAQSNIFLPTPTEWLTEAHSGGMSAHLQSPWMLFHPPLILCAYMLALSLGSLSLQQMLSAPSTLKSSGNRVAFTSWAILTAGIGTGMIWAFGDAGYGQFWHWDPVQTCIFILWCLLTAYLHIFFDRLGSSRSIVGPVIGVCCTLATLGSLALTRSKLLVSSHQYVGEASTLWHLLLIPVALGATVVVLVLRSRQVSDPARPSGISGVASKSSKRLTYVFGWMLMVALGSAALLAVGLSIANEVSGVAKPKEWMPFFETLRAWGTPEEQARIQRAFAWWDIDGPSLSLWLATLATGIALAGVWFFLRGLSKAGASIFLAVIFLASCITYSQGGFLGRMYSGSGLLSQRIVSIFPVLDALLIASAGFVISCLFWMTSTVRRAKSITALARATPLAIIHAGIGLVVIGGVVASCLNSYTQREIGPEISGSGWSRLTDDLQFRMDRRESYRSGEVGAPAPYREYASIQLKEHEVSEPIRGQIFLDDRKFPAGYSGPLREICEMVDYRYGRYASSPAYVISPLVSHGLRRDIQVWISPDRNGAGPAATAIGQVVVVKEFKWASLVWIGAIFSVTGALWMLLLKISPPRSAQGPK